MSTVEKCFELLHEYGVPGGVIYHIVGVTEIAVRLAKDIKERGLGVDVGLVMRIALLHDIGKSVYDDVRHVTAGYEIMSYYEGDETVAEGVYRHRLDTVVEDDARPDTVKGKECKPERMEHKVVWYADKIFTNEEISLKEGLDDLKVRRPDLNITEEVEQFAFELEKELLGTV